MATNNILNKTNASNLIPAEINAVVAIIENPKAFGDQIKELAKQKAIQAALGIVNNIKKEIEDVIKKKINLEINHIKKLYDLNAKANPPDIILNGEITKGIPILTEEEYNIAVALENKNYEDTKRLLQQDQDNLNERLLKIITDPYKKAKDKFKKLKAKLTKRKRKSKEEKARAKARRLKQLKNFAKKTLVPIAVFLLTEELIKIISNSEELQDLVDQTNAVIEDADTPAKIDQARTLRDNTLRIINDTENKILNVVKQLSQYQLYIQIFDAIITVILSIPIPTSVPPGIGLPVNFILKLQKVLGKAEKIVTGLSAALAFIIPILEEAIFVLEDLKLQLEDINSLLDGKTLGLLDNNQLKIALDSIRLTNGEFEEYKGFKFAIKEEQTLGVNTAQVVKGFKRHYAAAIDRDGVERIKSEYSFTQDPQVLVDQLKLIIDQKNLQG